MTGNGCGGRAVLSSSQFVYRHSDLHLERSGQPACICRIGVQHLCVLNEQPTQYPSGQPCLRIAVLADLRRGRPFMGRTAERVDHADLDFDVDHPIRTQLPVFLPELGQSGGRFRLY